MLSHAVELTHGQAWQITTAAASPTATSAIRAGGRNTFRLEMPASSVTTLVLTP